MQNLNGSEKRFGLGMMNRNTEYEKFTREVCELLAQSSGLKSSSVKHDVKLMGRSGQEHQVDVYWEYEKDGKVHRVAIECKNYNQKISIGKVRDFFGVLYDIGEIKGVMACKKGYQDGAKRFAERYNISLEEIRAPQEGETVIGQMRIEMQINSRRCLFKIDEDWAANHNFNISEYKRRLDSESYGRDREWSRSNHVPMETKDNFIRDGKDKVKFSIEELNCRTPGEQPTPNSSIYKLEDSYIKNQYWGLVKINEIKFEEKDILEHRNYSLDAREFVKAIIKDAQNDKKMVVLDFGNRICE